MKLVLTGGGTGGHIYPALEVGRLAQERGASLYYLGSLRGQEGRACAERGIPFEGFGSQPLYSLKTPAGWRALIAILRARSGAKRALRRIAPDVVFSTGGYSAAPVLSAAKALGIPAVIHEANSVPGRTNRLFGRTAKAFTCVFRHTESRFPELRPIRTGQPIRRELREAAAPAGRVEEPLVLVLGGSQGSEFLNEQVPQAASRLEGARFLHASGPAHFEKTAERVRRLGLEGYEVRAYLDTSEIVRAYSRARVFVGRSGGTLAELALYGLSSVLVPLPTSADAHQHHNAEEFVQMGAATLVPQDQASPERLACAIEEWLADEARRARARSSLLAWDVPDATERIVELLESS